MPSTWKSIVRELTPPIVVRWGYELLEKTARKKRAPAPDGMRDAEWYDRVFTAEKRYHGHYTRSGYYFLWTVIADRILRYDLHHILDLGCGPGQLACLLHDKGITSYHGIDFSPTSISMAVERGLPFTFAIGDLGRPDTLASLADEFPYDCVVTLEFLEHVEFDLEVLNRIRPGVRVIATVPNFPYTSHVRHFRNPTEVLARYGPLFSGFTVDSFQEDEAGRITFFLMDGIKA